MDDGFEQGPVEDQGSADDQGQVGQPSPVDEQVPVELSEALSQADAWPGWREQPADLRALYREWVARPRRASERRARAELTAGYARDGLLDKAVQRPGLIRAIASVFESIP